MDTYEQILCEKIAHEENRLRGNPIFTNENHAGAVRGLTEALQLYRIHMELFDEDVCCKICDRPCHIGDTHRHSSGYICNECWDERLKITE